MILPIVAYGDPVLKKKAEDITKDYEGLDNLIDDMFETMYRANGVGLAAPQIGKSIRLFVVDASPFAEKEGVENPEELIDFKKVFINPRIISEEGDAWNFEEGCLSIPDVHEEVSRQPEIKMSYLDRDFQVHEEQFSGMAARVIQHEYDHIEGILFTDKLSPLRKRMIKSKLANISKGRISVEYRMRFPKTK